MNTNQYYMTVDMNAKDQIKQNESQTQWEKDWEQKCICNTCVNPCYSKDEIVKSCSNYLGGK